MRLPGRWMLLILVACSPNAPGAEPGAGEITATGAYVYAPLTAAQASGYLVLPNPAAEPDTLVAVSVDWAAQAGVHETLEVDGMVRMRHRDRLVLPARDSVVLAPGGLHLMFMNLGRLPVAGDTVELRLEFSRGGSLAVPAPVRAYGQ